MHDNHVRRFYTECVPVPFVYDRIYLKTNITHTAANTDLAKLNYIPYPVRCRLMKWSYPTNPPTWHKAKSPGQQLYT